MAPTTPSSLPRLNTQPVPPTPLTSQITSAPASNTNFQNLPSVNSPIELNENSDPFIYDNEDNFEEDEISSKINIQYIDENKNSLESPSATPRSVLLSPLKTSPTNRPLSPDLPNRDALYLFSNFSSYMRSPNENLKGLQGDDFKDSIRLLEHARWLTSQPHSNVSILHIKYRFQGENATFRSPYSTGDYQLPINNKDSNGRIRNPVPQPFSVLHDPVVKIDYMENGVFDPLPAQAVFSHIAKVCQPPPRVIVISYVYSKVIENHLSSLATWAITSSPPSYIFSPLETRLRETQPLHIALGHSIPMSMYAWPNELYSPYHFRTPLYQSTNHNFANESESDKELQTFSPSKTNVSKEQAIMTSSKSIKGLSSPSTNLERRRQSKISQSNEENTKSTILLTRRISGNQSPNDIIDRYYARRTSNLQIKNQNKEQNNNLNSIKCRSYPDDPIASLTIISSPSKSSYHFKLNKSNSNESLNHSRTIEPIDRIPLWHLTPGVGILYGSISNSIGIKLSDFSAINFINKQNELNFNSTLNSNENEFKEKLNENEKENMNFEIYNRKNENNLINSNGLIETSINISRPSSTNPIPVPIGKNSINTQSQLNSLDNQITNKMKLLTPPDFQNTLISNSGNINTTQSWPAPISRVPGWRKGRKELMEDTLEELGLVSNQLEYPDEGQNEIENLEEISKGVENLALSKSDEMSRDHDTRSSQDLIDFLLDF
ncbi:uncharacterized protein I206_107549 [Kwoniella pini CBS 10737]|uniref:Uncharacterized protein n=1 Tax=Kwoniella pini CBS 10737 TaxID=1296096 RepID=A0A1B9HXM8_9TREE|nr:uncharacterized protein I206_05877 [Kwoniella pini CBS 10737]OCF48011.1 hypothetical protein I206_05877 [Kwoniella pini CBS 10737]